jgi:hypothetical protein
MIHDVLDKAFQEIRIGTAPFSPLGIDFDDYRIFVSDKAGGGPPGALAVHAVKGGFEGVEETGKTLVGSIGIFPEVKNRFIGGKSRSPERQNQKGNKRYPHCGSLKIKDPAAFFSVLYRFVEVPDPDAP